MQLQSENTTLGAKASQQQIQNAVEVLSNIHYLIEQAAGDRDSVQTLLEMACPAMETLRTVARGR